MRLLVVEMCLDRGGEPVDLGTHARPVHVGCPDHLLQLLEQRVHRRVFLPQPPYRVGELGMVPGNYRE